MHRAKLMYFGACILALNGRDYTDTRCPTPIVLPVPKVRKCISHSQLEKIDHISHYLTETRQTVRLLLQSYPPCHKLNTTSPHPLRQHPTTPDPHPLTNPVTMSSKKNTHTHKKPYFPEIYDRSGYPGVVRRLGPDHSYQLAVGMDGYEYTHDVSSYRIVSYRGSTIE